LFDSVTSEPLSEHQSKRSSVILFDEEPISDGEKSMRKEKALQKIIVRVETLLNLDAII
jgi:hypothetical protein